MKRARKKFGASDMDAAELRAALDVLGWQRNQAARYCGLSPDMMGRYLCGDYPPRRDTAALLRLLVRVKLGLKIPHEVVEAV